MPDLGMPALGGLGPAGALVTVGADPDRRVVLMRRIRWFVAATISYNVVEAVIALGEGVRVSSTALVGFGLDSVIEVSSAVAVAWQFAGRDPAAREQVALRVIAFSFFALALYVTVDSIRALTGAREAEHSTVGIVLASVSLAVMPVLSAAQRRAGRELGSASAVADSKQTLLCTYLSAVLLAGLLLNSAFAWSWADPIAALVIAAVAVKEGRDAWRGDICCPPPAAFTRSDAVAAVGATDARAARTMRRPLSSTPRILMSALPAAARARYDIEMFSAATALDSPMRWRHLEAAHILSQPDAWLHTRDHVAMLALAVRCRDRREALGQVLRIILAAPGSWSGRYPDGNTGRARVGLLQPMPVPAEIAALLRTA